MWKKLNVLGYCLLGFFLVWEMLRNLGLIENGFDIIRDFISLLDVYGGEFGVK